MTTCIPLGRSLKPWPDRANDGRAYAYYPCRGRPPSGRSRHERERREPKAVTKTWGEMTPEEREAFLSEVRARLGVEAEAARRAPAARRRRARRPARRVVLIGSPARGHFTLWSDVDLVAFGIPAERFFAAHGAARAAGLAARIPVELHCGDAEGFPAEALDGGVEL